MKGPAAEALLEGVVLEAALLEGLIALEELIKALLVVVARVDWVALSVAWVARVALAVVAGAVVSDDNCLLSGAVSGAGPAFNRAE